MTFSNSTTSTTKRLSFFIFGSMLVTSLLFFSLPTKAADRCVLTLRQLAVLRAKQKLPELVSLAAKPAGWILGSANDIVITFAGGTGILPPSISRWLPLSNEMANVAATATGRRWIYSGLSKNLADGVALGSIVGHSVSAGVEHGPIAGGLTFAANMGLTYWFPNKYFHTLMEGIPELIPASLPKTKAFAKSKPGQAVIGISMIVMIEQILKKSEDLASRAPSIGARKKDSSPTAANAALPTSSAAPNSPPAATAAAESDPEWANEIRVRKGVAGYLLEGALYGDGDAGDQSRDAMITYLAGASPERGLFTSKEELATLPPAQALDDKQIAKIRHLVATPEFSDLLDPASLQALTERIGQLKVAKP